MSAPLQFASESPRNPHRHEPAHWCLLAGAVVFSALLAPMVCGWLYVCDDLGAFHLPVRAFYARQLARGEPFDWMPHLFAGFYLTGEGQAGTYHPWHWVLYRWLPLHAAWTVELAATYPLMFAGMWLWLRRWMGRPEAAAAGSLMFTFGSFNLLHFLHPNAVAVVAHVPWLLWSIHLALTGARRWQTAGALGAMALLSASQVLLGYPQYVWFSLLAEAAFAAWLLAQQQCAGRRRGKGLSCARATPRQRAGRAVGFGLRLTVAKCAGIMAGGVQLLATWDAWSQAARRAAGSDYAVWGSLHPVNLVQLVAPYLFAHRSLDANTHEMSAYLGAVPLVLIVWVACRRRHLGPLRNAALAAALFAAFGLLMALGRFGPLYWFQGWLPVVGGFRFPCRYLVLFQLGASVLAAIGFVLLIDHYCRARQLTRQKAAVPRLQGGEKLWALSKLSVAVALAGIVLQGHPRMGGLAGVLAGPVLITAAVVMVILAARGSRIALAGMVAFMAADLGAYGLSYLAPGAARPESFLRAVRSHGPPAGPDGRLVACLLPYDAPGLRMGNALTLLGWERADGYAGLEPRQRLDYRNLTALRIAGVQWVHRGPTTAGIAGLLPVDRQWSRVPQPLPYVRMVTDVCPSSEPAAQIQQIDVQTTALSDLPLALPRGEAGTATLLDRRPGRLVVKTECRTRQLLVVAESWHPGWQVVVGNTWQPVLRVNGDFLGALVEPGRRRVVFEFRPRSLRLGWRVSAAGLGLAALCVLSTWLEPGKRTGAGRGHCGTARPDQPPSATAGPFLPPSGAVCPERQRVQDL